MIVKNNKRGITLLVALLTTGILLAISASLAHITLKQYQLSGIALSSEIAFQAANAGMECIRYHDFINESLDVGDDRSVIRCFNKDPNAGVPSGDEGSGNGKVDSGEAQRFQFSWGNPETCVDVSLFRFFNDATDIDMILPNGENWNIDRDGNGSPDKCPAGSVCSVLQSRGYNLSCDNLTSSRVVEREYTQVY